MQRIRRFFHRATAGMQELSFLGQRHILVIYKKNGQLLYRWNAGIAVLVLAVIDLVFPALVVLGLFTAFILGIRARFQRVY